LEFYIILKIVFKFHLGSNKQGNQHAAKIHLYLDMKNRPKLATLFILDKFERGGVI